MIWRYNKKNERRGKPTKVQGTSTGTCMWREKKGKKKQAKKRKKDKRQRIIKNIKK